MARWRTLGSRAQHQRLRVRLVVFVLVWNAALLLGALLGLNHPLGVPASTSVAKSPLENRVHSPRDLLLALHEHVSVRVGRQHDRAVAELVLDVLKGEALRQ